MNLSKVRVESGRVYKWVFYLVAIAIMWSFAYWFYTTKEFVVVEKGSATYAKFCSTKPEVCGPMVKKYYGQLEEFASK